ncbi:unnamed protein product [Hymenolepis diminuta]|uniref:Uncharacterized protein n=1 Tax=Hymenolepis diminuta TaxID=6216 RepID=A0A564Z3V0_HYMDI|nr:unnamed protein product [Hymenolepis diminuta]
MLDFHQWQLAVAQNWVLLSILLSVRLPLSFRQRSSFLKPPAENHLLRVF